MSKYTPAEYCGISRWEWMTDLAHILNERALVGKHITNYGWDDLPESYKPKYPDRDPANYRTWFSREYGSAPVHPAIQQAVTLAPPADWHLLVLEHPHAADSDPSRIAYTRSDAHGYADRQTVTSVGKYIARHFPTMPDHWVRDIAMRHVPYKFVLWDTVPKIVQAVQDGPHSCMRWEHCNRDNDMHPYEVYDPKYGWRIAVRLGASELITARCLVNIESMTFVRSYTRRDNSNQYSHSDEAIEVWLRDQGFEKACDWDGLKLAKITKGRYSDDFWAPYIDGNIKTVFDHGEHLLIDSYGDYECDRTDGHANGASNCSCGDCGDRVHEDDLRSVGYHGDRQVGECCIGDYTYVHGRGGDEYYICSDYAIEVNGEYYDPDYLDRHGIVELDCGDYAHQDDAVHLDYRDIWVHTDDDCWVHCHHSGTTEHSDDCVQLESGDWALEQDAWQCEHDEQWYLCDEDEYIETPCGKRVHEKHADEYTTNTEEN